MVITITGKAETLLRELAAEDGMEPETFIEAVLTKEDRERHVIHPPFEGERRTRCNALHCEVPDTRPTEHYEL